MPQNEWFDEWLARSRADAEKAERRERFRAKWFPAYEDVTRRATIWTGKARFHLFLVALVLSVLAALMDATGLTDTRAGAVVFFLVTLAILVCLSCAVAGRSSWDDDGAGD